jgi:NitT/TauT family transport system permease protein
MGSDPSPVESKKHREPWFAVRKDLDGKRSSVLMTLSFVLPLVVWIVASYGPFWKALHEVQISAESPAVASVYVPGDRLAPEYFTPFQEAIRKDNAAVQAGRDSGTPLEATARQNKKVVRQIFPLALGNGWVGKDAEADDEALRGVWVKLASGELVPGEIEPSSENEKVIKANAALLSGAEWPTQALLKLVPQSRVSYDYPVYLVPPHRVFATAWADIKGKPDVAGAEEAAENKSDAKPLLVRYQESLRTISLGFLLAAVLAIPLGILAGTYSFFSRLLEPFTDFFRYMPAPTFGVVLMAVFGLEGAPKIMLVFIGTFPTALLVIANTTRQLDVSLLEAAQTLGANQKQLVTRVIIPGIMPTLYNDLRILIGCAWTWLVIAELLGFKSGLTEIIDTRGRRFQFEHVYPAILMIGLTGFFTDQFLGWLGRGLFPWAFRGQAGSSRWFINALAYVPRMAVSGMRAASAYAAKPPMAPIATDDHGISPTPPSTEDAVTPRTSI